MPQSIIYLRMKGASAVVKIGDRLRQNWEIFLFFLFFLIEGSV